MRVVIAIQPLPEWQIDGVKYTPNERSFRTSPPELDQGINVPVGSWYELPSGDKGIAVASRLKKQNGKQLESKPGEPARFEGGTHPTLQRFAFEIRQLPEAGDNLELLFADVPIRKADGTAAENPVADARAEIEKLTAEVAKLSDEAAAKDARIAALEADLEKATAPTTTPPAK